MLNKQKALNEIATSFPSANGYLALASEAIMQASLACDYARSAEKMLKWECVGEVNEAWKVGPFISAPSASPQINRRFPYIISTSIETRKIAEITVSGPPSGNGGYKIDLPDNVDSSNRSEHVISRMAIIEKFEIFKFFIAPFDGPYNKKRCKEWGKIETKWIMEELLKAIERRNALTHDMNFTAPTMKEAVEYFYNLIHIAPVLEQTAQRNTDLALKNN